MKQEYFVVVLAHSLRGRLRRIHIPHQAVYVILALAFFGCFSVFGFVASYARMAWKVANYNALRTEADTIRARYQTLLREVNQTDQQLASLELYANEVSVAYGLKQKLEGPPDIAAEGKLVPSYAESVQDYDFLRGVNRLALPDTTARGFRPSVPPPAGWPVEGRLTGSFGSRLDPFSGEGSEFHRGVDFSAPPGTPVHATANGIVIHAEPEGGYGRLVIVDHGGEYQTWYAHLSRFYVHVGEEVRHGDLLGAVGSSGRTTAPHLHYEVHVNGLAQNPHRFLAAAPAYQQASRREFPF